MILAGDVGGTKTILACFSPEGEELTPLKERSYKNADYPDLEAILKACIAEGLPGELRGACFGVAAPVVGERVRMTNLPWTVDAGRLRLTLGIEEVALLNDLVATGYGIETLDPEDWVTLQTGRPRRGNAALIAAGTGLGQAILFWDGERQHPSASEGGHTDFGPRSQLEIELLEHLMKELEHVSYERVVSGPGLLAIYRFLKETGRGEEPEWLARALSRTSDPAAIISEAALSGRSKLCEGALELFVSLYGAEAGNLALKALAVAGVYVGGGIAPRILDKLKEGGFVEAFCAKGRYRSYMEDLPVRVITNPKTALRGAAHYATLRMRGRG